MTNIQLFITIIVMAAGTLVTRFLPFFLFPDNKKTSPYIRYLGRVLPFSVIGMLVVYCLKSAAVTASFSGAAEGIAILCIIFLHLWKKNTLLSIAAGTAVYMFLIQRVFIT